MVILPSHEKSYTSDEASKGTPRNSRTYRRSDSCQESDARTAPGNCAAGFTGRGEGTDTESNGAKRRRLIVDSGRPRKRPGPRSQHAIRWEQAPLGRALLTAVPDRVQEGQIVARAEAFSGRTPSYVVPAADRPRARRFLDVSAAAPIAEAFAFLPECSAIGISMSMNI